LVVDLELGQGFDVGIIVSLVVGLGVLEVDMELLVNLLELCDDLLSSWVSRSVLAWRDIDLEGKVGMASIIREKG